jgi:hypothetical protein
LSALSVQSLPLLVDVGDCSWLPLKLLSVASPPSVPLLLLLMVVVVLLLLADATWVVRVAEQLTPACR